MLYMKYCTRGVVERPYHECYISRIAQLIADLKVFLVQMIKMASAHEIFETHRIPAFCIPLGCFLVMSIVQLMIKISSMLYDKCMYAWFLCNH